MATDYIDAGGKNSGWIEQALPIVRTLPVPAGVESGDVVLLEELVCYAQSDRDTDGNARVMIPADFVEIVPVTGKDAADLDSAIAIGNALYYDAAPTPSEINLDVTNGKRFGYALETVTSGATAEIEVAFSQ
jgi:predicted RecA/RadA family phage recombinase